MKNSVTQLRGLKFIVIMVKVLKEMNAWVGKPCSAKFGSISFLYSTRWLEDINVNFFTADSLSCTGPDTIDKKFSLNKWPTCKICTWSTHFTPFIDDKWTWKIWRNFHSYSDANDKWWAENRAWVPIQWNKLQAQSVRHRAPNFKGSFRQVRSKFKIIYNRVDICTLKFY